MTRTILHCDCNNFYATVEGVFDASLKGKPVVVCGDPQLRHGIVLAKSYAAKACGIVTGDTIWQAKLKCPTLTLVAADLRRYLGFSRKMREIGRRYTQLVEPFGLDENWLDVTGHALDGEEIAAQIRKAAKKELGITVSIGVSFNKIFAKLGSEMRKPDATTVITEDNFKEKVWPLPAQDLLFVGRATRRHLNELGLYQIGDIAGAELGTLKAAFGKNGETLWRYARGEDESPVLCLEHADDIKSISNSTTPPHDIASDEDAKAIIYLLSDSVASRLRAHQVSCRTVSVWMRDTQLGSFERQCRLPVQSDIADEIAQAAMALFRQSYPWDLPLRSLGVRSTDLEGTQERLQIPLWDAPQRIKTQHFERALDAIRGRYGHTSVQRGLLLCDRALTGINPVDDHALQPLSAMHGRE
ncbi:MAG: DNA polymerase IV [Christensenellales bacterium]